MQPHEPILDEIEICEHFDQVREDHKYAEKRPGLARALFENGPLHYVMRDMALELTGDGMQWAGVKPEHLEPEGDNLEAFSAFKDLSEDSNLMMESLAAEGLMWAHAIASDWRDDKPTDPRYLDLLERILLRLANRRLITPFLEPHADYPALPKQLAALELRLRGVQQQRFTERSEHKQLRVGANKRESGRRKADQALSDKTAARYAEILKVRDKLKAQDKAHGLKQIRAVFEEHGGYVPSISTISRALNKENET